MQHILRAHIACNAFQLSFLAPSESWDSVSACVKCRQEKKKSKRKARMKAQHSHQRRADGAQECRLLSWSPRRPSHDSDAPPGLLLTSVHLRCVSWLAGPCCCSGDPLERRIPRLVASGRSMSPEPTPPEGPRHRDASLSLKTSQHLAPGTSGMRFPRSSHNVCRCTVQNSGSENHRKRIEGWRLCTLCMDSFSGNTSIHFSLL